MYGGRILIKNFIIINIKLGTKFIIGFSLSSNGIITHNASRNSIIENWLGFQQRILKYYKLWCETGQHNYNVSNVLCYCGFIKSQIALLLFIV